jgi:hypothetical protein
MGLAEELIKQGGWEWRQGQATRPQDTMPDIAMITKQVNLKWAELVRLGRITHAMATGENQELLHQAVADEQARPRLIVSDEARAKILEFPRRADDVEPELPRGTS